MSFVIRRYFGESLEDCQAWLSAEGLEWNGTRWVGSGTRGNTSYSNGGWDAAYWSAEPWPKKPPETLEIHTDVTTQSAFDEAT